MWTTTRMLDYIDIYRRHCLNSVSIPAMDAGNRHGRIDHYGRWFAKSVRERMEKGEQCQKPFTAHSAARASMRFVT